MSVRREQLVSNWTCFYEICYYRNVRKFVKIDIVLLKSDKNKEHFAWKKIHIYVYISLSYS